MVSVRESRDGEIECVVLRNSCYLLAFERCEILAYYGMNDMDENEHL
jgi:hypothetical protein